MGELIVLREPRLVPVLELEPWKFSAEGRPRPTSRATTRPRRGAGTGSTASPTRGSPAWPRSGTPPGTSRFTNSATGTG